MFKNGDLNSGVTAYRVRFRTKPEFIHPRTKTDGENASLIFRIQSRDVNSDWHCDHAYSTSGTALMIPIAFFAPGTISFMT